MHPPPLLPTRIDTQWKERRNTQRHTLHVDSVESICILTYVCTTRTWQMQVDPLLIICEIIEPQTTDNVYLWIRASFNHKIIPREKKIFWGSFDACFFWYLISMETAAGIPDGQLLNFRCQKYISHCWLTPPWSVHTGSNNSGRAVPSTLFCR